MIKKRTARGGSSSILLGFEEGKPILWLDVVDIPEVVLNAGKKPVTEQK